MNENIDLTKILEGCPKGTKFWSPIFGEVIFDEICDGNVKVEEECGLKAFRWDGTYLMRDSAECLLFPSKDQRDWAKFERFWDKPKVENFDPKTFQPFDKILVRRDIDCLWVPRFFGYMDGFIPRGTDGISYPLSIPYNDDTKHLVGKYDDCPEFYKWWEK